uniref:Uncharacterized protein n=1 Tax=Pyrodinium bahamense TaxID=73915 RepID=A0A7S0AF56_9DINO
MFPHCTGAGVLLLQLHFLAGHGRRPAAPPVQLPVPALRNATLGRWLLPLRLARLLPGPEYCDLQRHMPEILTSCLQVPLLGQMYNLEFAELTVCSQLMSRKLIFRPWQLLCNGPLPWRQRSWHPTWQQ